MDREMPQRPWHGLPRRVLRAAGFDVREVRVGEVVDVRRRHLSTLTHGVTPRFTAVLELGVGRRVDTESRMVREVAVPVRLFRREMRVRLEFPGAPVEVAWFTPPDTGCPRAVNPILMQPFSAAGVWCRGLSHRRHRSWMGSSPTRTSPEPWESSAAWVPSTPASAVASTPALHPGGNRVSAPAVALTGRTATAICHRS